MLLQKFMFVSKVLLQPRFVLMSLLPPRAMLMSIVHAVQTHADARRPYCLQEPYWLNDLHCHMKLWRYLLSELSSRALSRSMAGSHLHDLCCHLKASGGLWSMLPWRSQSTEASFTVVLMSTDTQMRERDIDGFCDDPYLHQPPTSIPKTEQPRQEATKENP